MIKGHIIYTGAGNAKALAAATPEIIKQANFAALLHWHRKFVPGHFKPAAESKYGYAPRSGQNEPARVPNKRKARVLTRGGRTFTETTVLNDKYWHRKRRAKGHTRPLVWSGRSERRALQKITVTGTHKIAKGVMSVDKYFYQYRKDLKAPDKAAELTTITADEAHELSIVHRRSVREQMAALRTIATKRIA